MERIIKEFQSTFECGQIMTIYTFKAIIKPSYFPRYRLKLNATGFKDGEIKSTTQSEMYFKTEKN